VHTLEEKGTTHRGESNTKLGKKIEPTVGQLVETVSCFQWEKGNFLKISNGQMNLVVGLEIFLLITTVMQTNWLKSGSHSRKTVKVLNYFSWSREESEHATELLVNFEKF